MEEQRNKSDLRDFEAVNSKYKYANKWLEKRKHNDLCFVPTDCRAVYAAIMQLPRTSIMHERL
jgi:hypothetical protein